MICIAGKNDIATNVLTFVVHYFGAGEVVAVANRDDSGRATWQHSLIATAKRLGVRLVSLAEAYEIPKLHFFSVEFDRIVVPERFRQAEIYNIHFSLLPRYKGVYTAIWPILNGDLETGVTLHRMEVGIDTGAIIEQATCSIELNSTARDVYHKCLEMGYDILRNYIPRLVNQPVFGTPQTAAQSTYYGPKSIDFSNLTINLRQTAFQIHNAVRAFTFQEYQLPTVLGRRVRASHITNKMSNMPPGAVLNEDERRFTISTIDYNLDLIKDYSLNLLEAVMQRDVATVQRLAAMVPDLDFRTRQGWTPLMVAAYANDSSVSGALLEAGADVNAVNKNGTSVLMYAKTAAARENKLHILQLLQDMGADVRGVDILGKSVLDYAHSEANPRVITFLSRWLNAY